MVEDYKVWPRNNGIWYYKLRGERNYHSTHCRTEEEAREYAEAVLQGKSPIKHSRILKEFTKDFFIWGVCKWTNRQLKKGKRFSLSHATDRRGFLVNHIYPKFGGRYIDSLSPEEIEDWLIDLEHLSNHTKNQILYTFRIVLDEAVRYQLLGSNPARKIDPFAANHAHRDIYDERELQALFPLDMDRFSQVWEDFRVGTMSLLMLTTGMRHGEARALQWKDIHARPELNFVMISKGVKHNGSIGSTKNRESRLAILIDEVIPFLMQLRSLSPHNGPADFIFTLNGKKPYWTNYSYKHLNRACENAGIEKSGRKLDFHSFRHTFITQQRMQNADEKALELLVGHHDKKVTDIYDHQQIEDTIRFLTPHKNQLESIWGKIFQPETGQERLTALPS